MPANSPSFANSGPDPDAPLPVDPKAGIQPVPAASSHTPEPSLLDDTTSHPVATGLGAAGGGAMGAVVGSTLGPIGAVVGSVVGAVLGGLGASAAAETVTHAAEEQYWREAHPGQEHVPGSTFEELHPAYRAGYEGHAAYHEIHGSFEESEKLLREHYENYGGKLPWEEVRLASRAAWDRVDQLRRERASGAQIAC